LKTEDEEIDKKISYRIILKKNYKKYFTGAFDE